MPTNQLIVPTQQEEDAVVGRFIEDSREIAPTVQVTLAKRFVRPGSNRVVCLAARTTIPLNEDEMASVSDLALKLSDGTNVHLSLSFFSDELSNQPLFPVNRVIYDPARYRTVQAEPRLGKAFALTALITLVGLYLIFGRGGAFLHLPLAFRSSFAPRVSAPTPAVARPVATAKKPSSSQAPAASVARSSPTRRLRTNSPRTKTAAARAAGEQSQRKPQTMLMVPPPPPPSTYTWPYGVPLPPPFDQLTIPGAPKPVASRPGGQTVSSRARGVERQIDSGAQSVKGTQNYRAKATPAPSQERGDNKVIEESPASLFSPQPFSPAPLSLKESPNASAQAAPNISPAPELSLPIQTPGSQAAAPVPGIQPDPDF